MAAADSPAASAAVSSQRPLKYNGSSVSPSDEQLISRLAAQDREAFAQFYDRHAPRVLGLLTRMLGVRGEADDVLQETFWQVWTRAASYDPQRSSPLIWLILIARSRARDQLRRRRRRDAPTPAGEAPLVADVASETERAEDTQIARSALAQLPDEQRNLIRLAFFSGMTHEQIAAAESIPVGTVKTRIRRGMMRLREIVENRQKAVAS